MNIYRVIEDGQDFCVRAATMREAIDICEARYMREVMSEAVIAVDQEGEKENYHEQVLHSCELIGPLLN